MTSSAAADAPAAAARRDAVPGEQVGHEVQVRLGDLRAQTRDEVAGVARGELLRDEQVHAVRPPADLFLDPRELRVELRAVNAEAPSTPSPPAFVTAATTAGERLKPTMGCATPTSSVNGVRTVLSPSR